MISYSAPARSPLPTLLNDNSDEWLWLADILEDTSAVFALTSRAVYGDPAGKPHRGPSIWQLAWFVGQTLLGESSGTDVTSPFVGFERALLRLLYRQHKEMTCVVELVPPVEAEEVDAGRMEQLVDFYEGRTDVVPALVSARTLNTVEHRHIAGFLRRLHIDIALLEVRLRVLFDTDEQALRSSHGVAPGLFTRTRAQALKGTLNRLDAIRAGILRLRQLPFLAAIPIGRESPMPTQVFLHDPLYRLLWGAMSSYERMPRPSPADNGAYMRLALAERWYLFQIWVLYRLRDALVLLGGSVEGSVPMLADPTRGLRKGAMDREELQWQLGSGTKLRYQPSFKGSGSAGDRSEREHSVSVTLEPDFVVNMGGHVVVLDAKCVADDKISTESNDVCRSRGVSGGSEWRDPLRQAHVYAHALRLGNPPRPPEKIVLLLPEEGAGPDPKFAHLFGEGGNDTGIRCVQLPAQKACASRILADLLNQILTEASENE